MGVFGFIGNSVQVYLDATERDQLLSDSRFLIERMTREIPCITQFITLSSSGCQRHCLEFVPIEAQPPVIRTIAPATATDEIVAVEITEVPVQFRTVSGALSTSNADILWCDTTTGSGAINHR